MSVDHKQFCGAFLSSISSQSPTVPIPQFWGISIQEWNPLCPEAPLLQTYNMSRSRHRTFFSVGVSHLWVKIGPLRVCVQKRESGWRKWLVIEQRASLRWAPPPATGHKVEQPASQHCLSSHWNCPQSKLAIVKSSPGGNQLWIGASGSELHAATS